MFYLIAAIIVSTAIIVLFKLFERNKIDNFQAITINYVFAAGLGFLLYKGEISPVSIANELWFPYALIIGFSFIVVFYVFALSARKAGVVITAISSKMSVVIPVFLGVILYEGVYLNAMKVTGLLSSLIAFHLIFKTERGIKLDLKYFIFPILLFLGNGFNDTMLNYSKFQFLSSTNEIILFLNTIFSIALIIGIFVISTRSLIHKRAILLKNIVAGALLGLLNFGSTYFFLKALGVYDPTVFFPIFNVGLVALATIVGYALLKEKIRPVNWLGIFVAIFTILIIAFA